MAETNSIRLNKYISESGICSRREADRFIEQGVVFINGVKAKIGQQVLQGDRVEVNGNSIEPMDVEDAIYLAFNKPVGITCTTEKGVRDNIINYIRYGQRIFPIGRLDKDSQGLIFLTSNGDIVNKILRAGNQHEKEYLVTVNKLITDNFIEGMANGVPMMGVTTRKCFVKKETPFIFRIVLIQGLNRQIRRMCEHFGYEETKLERQRIMNISLKGLPTGEWRELTKREMDIIQDMIRDSDVTEGSSGTNRKNSKKKKSSNIKKEQAEKQVAKVPEQSTKTNRIKSRGTGKGNNKKGIGKRFSKQTGPKKFHGRSGRKSSKH